MTTSDVDRLEDRYRVRFAGHPRVSRDPEELEKIVADLQQLSTTAEPALQERIANLALMYTKEVEAIQAAINVPFAVPAARLRMWADLTMSRYARRFAGADRRTRDVALLEELSADLQALRNAMSAMHDSAPDQKLDQSLVSVDSALQVYKTETEAIRSVRRSGSLTEQGSRLAGLANNQFETYGITFAKQSRLSRHPPALERIIRALEEIRRGMTSLKIAGFNDTTNDRNMGVVDERLKQYRVELLAIRQAQKDASVTDRVGALGGAANEVFAMYREHFSGKSRQQVDPVKLDELFERLWPVAREMDALDESHDDESNARNLGIVTDNLLLYSREYGEIRKVKG